MKKILPLALVLMFFSPVVFSQNSTSVDLSDDIYCILDYYQIKGYLNPLPGVKPYARGVILDAIYQIQDHEEVLSPSEKKVLNDYVEKYAGKRDKKNGPGHFDISNGSDNFPVSFKYDFSLDGSASSGIYTDSSFNKGGFDFITKFGFNGDVTKYLSYNLDMFIDFTTMPLYKCSNDFNYDKPETYKLRGKNSEYLIGYYWYNDDVVDFLDGEKYTIVGDDRVYVKTDDDGKYYYLDKDKVRHDLEDSEVHEFTARPRTIKKFLNTSYLPFRYHKKWSGQIYLLSDLSASGLEGWATEPGISGGITAEVRSSLFDNRFNIGAGRTNKEWAGMENGSSLVLNANAQPFFEFDTRIELFPWLHFSTLVGILEYPNQDYINENAFSEVFKNKDEATVYQNAFSINMVDFDWKYVHLDLGSNVIWPKRFELGYMFPLVLYVEYQNHIGDYDNMALFGDIKFRIPKIGSIWGSLYFDELNITSDWFKQTRVMYAGQLGSKFVLPFLPFGSISMRYTKIEPFCYTHNSVDYTPWYSHYVSTAYVNNGEGLGYYLDPNSDEFFLRIETIPSHNTALALQYQFIRHGADYGSQQVPGSSYYSELSPENRDELEKFFLHDGAYNWMHIISLEGKLTHQTKKHNTVELSANCGFMYSYWTMIDDEKYDRSIYGNNGNCKDVDSHTKYSFVDNDEYPVQCGVVLGAGLKIIY